VLVRLDLRFFKCFELLRLPLAPLTLLSGPNSSGKSSVLQALVLLHQTMREHEWSTRLALNGSGVQLGTVVDVVDEMHGRNGFEIGLTAEDASCHWVFDGDRREMSIRVRRVSVDGRASEVPGTLRCLLPPDADGSVAPLAAGLRGLTYITAERVGPQEAYPLEDPYDVVLGSKGEHAVSVLHWGRDEPVLSTLALPGVPRTLLRQVQARMIMFSTEYAVRSRPDASHRNRPLFTSSDPDPTTVRRYRVRLSTQPAISTSGRRASSTSSTRT
jgi:hypothetical protein